MKRPVIIAITILVVAILHSTLLSFFHKTLPDLTWDPEPPGIPIFPPNFKFGVSTSAYQVEEDIPPSNWLLWENVTDDRGIPRAPSLPQKVRGYTHFLKDADLAKSLGCDLYRFSLSWSRLNPAPGVFDSEALAVYKSWLIRLREIGIEPLVTLWHFEHPAWLEQNGSVHGKEFVPRFTEYARFVIDGIGDLCDLWHTTNEPVGFGAAAYIAGLHPPGKGTIADIVDALANLAQAHAIAYDMIHAKNPKAKVSFAKNLTPFAPMHQWSLLEALEAWIFNVYNRLGFDVFETETISLWGHTRPVKNIKGKLDFISLNHYYIIFPTIAPYQWSIFENRTMVSLTYGESRLETSDFAWGLKPSSLADSIRWVDKIHNPRRLPFLISEHGCADATDERRQRFLSKSLAHLSIAAKEIPIMGYVHWTLMDNYEWATGTKMRFGLFETNFETFERTKRKSASLYEEIIAANRQTA
jgi:beta-glucosidase